MPLVKGQSGNPGGCSRKVRARTKLREALDAIATDRIPEVWLDRMDPDLVATLPEKITWAQLIALRVILIGATSSKSAEVMAAAGMIAGTQDAILPDPEKLGSPVLTATETQRKEIAAELGVEEPSGPIN